MSEKRHPGRSPGRRAWPAALLVLGVAGMVLGACTPEEPGGSTAAPTVEQAVKIAPLTIAAVGDSLTAGYGVAPEESYPALLETRLREAGRTVRVVNAGVSGETSRGTLARIDWVVDALAPDVVILETGANDGLRGQSTDTLAENLDRIVTTLHAAGVTVILAGMRLPPNLGAAYTRAFADAYTRVAELHDVPLIPFFLEPIAAEPRFFQPDRLHPTAAGYRRIVAHILPTVERVLDELQGRP